MDGFAVFFWRAIKPAFVLAVLCGYATAARADGVPVWIDATTNDAVGRQLVYSTKEAIRLSDGFRLADRAEDARLTISVVTMDYDKQSNSTVYSAVYTLESWHETPVTMYLTQYVGVCGSSRVSSCADNLVAMADAQAYKVRAMLRRVLDEDERKGRPP